jgi:peptidoglycan hydrolase-like protein with peptidoglycan-binding domain
VDGDGMWIWYVSKSSGGTPAGIAAKAAKHGVSTVYIKAADSGSQWSQFSRPLVRQLKARGLKVCAWQFVYGNYPIGEAEAGAAAKRDGADCLVIDAESHYEGKYASAQIYMKRLRARVGSDFELALTSFPYVHYHPGFPYSVFMGPDGAQSNLPQMYWKDIGVSVDEIYRITWTYNSVYGRPIYPLGQTYSNPASTEVRRFRKLATAYGATGLSWWVWQFSGDSQWNALGSPFEPIGLPRRRDTPPLLARKARSDLVVWAQQHLLRLGLLTTVNGDFGAGTERAVRTFQRDRGLPVTGKIDAATWPALLPTGPAPVRWSAARRYATGATRRGGAPHHPLSGSSAAGTSPEERRPIVAGGAQPERRSGEHRTGGSRSSTARMGLRRAPHRPLNASEPARRNELAGKPGP